MFGWLGSNYLAQFFRLITGTPTPPSPETSALSGTIHVNARLTGSINAHSQLTGTASAHPRHTGNVRTYPT